ncbi:hypothetical protein D934_09590 [Xylella fastidiosa subsp. sandyi Ann-1]|uniref:Uncharacterized protein n=1 Tax=Xylella fastidiosa subsp. sandyi Ann-1 TaxID=155920 RepID=A0A060HDK8_XYLFS|nr:hypothetical protein D934_09590 [Xylella fastidiosa subsp. sandyi Ann-1]
MIALPSDEGNIDTNPSVILVSSQKTENKAH